MTVSTIATIAAGLTRTLGTPNAQANSIFTNLLGGQRSQRDAVSTDITAVIGLQSQIAQFRTASRDVAQAGALLSTAQNGAEQINQRLARLNEIAARAAEPTATSEDRAILNIEFQSVRAQIDQTARNTRFGNESLLDGSSAQLRVANNTAAGQPNLSVGSLTDATLFRGANLDVSTQSGARVAQASVRAAIDFTATQISNIQSLQGGLDLASASLQSAIQNQESAASNLTSDDFTTQLFALTEGRRTFGFDSADIQNAQTRRLPPSYIALLGE